MLTAEFARRFDVEPRVAMLSFSNFGSNTHAVRAQGAAGRGDRRGRAPGPGDRRRDAGRHGRRARRSCDESYPWSRAPGPANVLVFPELQSANIAYKLIWRLAGAEAIGPILLGLDKPVHVLQRGWR